MEKARRKLDSNLKVSDAVLMVVDARIPRSGRHHELEKQLQTGSKPLFFVLSKSDLAEADITARWLQDFRERQLQAVELRANKGRGAGNLKPVLKELRGQVNEARKRKGLRERDPRLLVVGLPNVGKSSLLNRLVGGSRAKTGRKPGVTRGSQWVVAEGQWQVLDTPGILYPRIETEEQLAYLAATGAIRPDVLPLEEVTADLLTLLLQRQRAGDLLGEPPYPEKHLLPALLARRRGFLRSGQDPDIERAARWLLSALFEGKFGPISLESPEVAGEED